MIKKNISTKKPKFKVSYDWGFFIIPLTRYFYQSINNNLDFIFPNFFSNKMASTNGLAEAKEIQQ